MRSEARWFIRSLGSGRAGTAGTSGYMRRCRRRLRFMALPSPAGAELPARLRPRQSCPALLRFALVWCSLVWGFSQAAPELPSPHETGRAFCILGLCSCARSREECPNGDSLLLLLVLCYYITSKPHSSREQARRGQRSNSEMTRPLYLYGNSASCSHSPQTTRFQILNQNQTAGLFSYASRFKVSSSRAVKLPGFAFQMKAKIL